TYTVTLDTQGAFADTHGDFGTVARTVSVTIAPATLLQEIIAWLYTLAYLVLFAAILNLVRTLLLTPAPYGTWERSSSRQGKTARAQSFSRALRSPWAWFLHRNILTSKQAFRTPGLKFRFQRGGLIEVKLDGPEGQHWSSTSGRLSEEAYAAAKVLSYRPAGADRDGLDGESEAVTYTITAAARGVRAGGGGKGGKGGGAGGRSTRTLGARPVPKRGTGRGGRGGKSGRANAGSRAGSRGGGDSLFGGI
ncbi:MAG TPA: hypothetical protein VKC57_09700, partial [Ktedonobacterales bacterium]|nr:hypothetical protein [Ktedonobacterales bacterium]